MRSFSTEGIGLNGHMGLTFSKKVGFRKVEIQTNIEHCPKIVRNGSRKMIWGSREVRKGQNCAPDAMEALPDPKNLIKTLKIKVLGGYMENSRSTALAAAILCLCKVERLGLELGFLT